VTNEINVNQGVVLLPSATRTSTTTSADQDNPYWKGLVVYLNITQASGTGGIQLNVQFKDPASGTYVVMLQDSVRTTTGFHKFILYPASNLAGDVATVAPLSRTWNIQVSHGDSSNYTYSVGASLIK
jgi:hypothetical protein